MVPVQAAVYNWVKQTGTLRMDPQAAVVGKVQRDYATLNNKAMELRKARPAGLSGHAVRCACSQARRGPGVRAATAA